MIKNVHINIKFNFNMFEIYSKEIQEHFHIDLRLNILGQMVIGLNEVSGAT